MPSVFKLLSNRVMNGDIKEMLSRFPGATAIVHTLQNGVKIVALQAEGGGSKNMSALSAFDRAYLSNGHGGNPVTWGTMAPRKFKIELNKGVNNVPLLSCSGVDQIESIEVTPKAQDADPIALTLEKFSFNPNVKQKSITSKNLMDCRTMFVPYRDTMTGLRIHAPVNCSIQIN